MSDDNDNGYGQLTSEQIAEIESQLDAANGSASVTYATAQLRYPCQQEEHDPESTYFLDVLRFHLHTGSRIGLMPHVPTSDAWVRRRSTIAEEFGELCAAQQTRDIEAYAGAIAGLAHAVIGAAVDAGIDLDSVWAAAHAASMSRADANVMDPDGWRPPDISGAIERGSDLRALAAACARHDMRRRRGSK